MPGDDLFTGRPPEVSLLTTRVPPPAVMYVSREDKLRVLAWGAAGAAVVVSGRLLRADGEIVPFVQEIITPSDRTYTNTYITLAEGFLLSVEVSAHGQADTRIGTTWVQMIVLRGGIVGGGANYLLAQGYVTGIDSVAWPVPLMLRSTEGPGRLRSITGTDPAAGAEISETVPTNARWLLHGWSAVLVTDATVMSRQVSLIFDDGTNILFAVINAATQAASLTYRYSGGAGMGNQTVVAGNILFATPVSLLLAAGWRLRTSTAGLVAGDNWGAPQLWVEEWLEE